VGRAAAVERACMEGRTGAERSEAGSRLPRGNALGQCGGESCRPCRRQPQAPTVEQVQDLTAPNRGDTQVFERFTDTTRRVVVLAQEEARYLKHNYIGVEHLLLGILTAAEQSAAKEIGR